MNNDEPSKFEKTMIAGAFMVIGTVLTSVCLVGDPVHLIVGVIGMCLVFFGGALKGSIDKE
jgi:hypothetical protein